MPKKVKKTLKKAVKKTVSHKTTHDSQIIQFGALFVFIGAIMLVAYVVKMYL